MKAYIISPSLIAFQRYCMANNITFAKCLDTQNKLRNIGMIYEDDRLVILPEWEHTNINKKDLKAIIERFKIAKAEVKDETV